MSKKSGRRNSPISNRQHSSETKLIALFNSRDYEGMLAEAKAMQQRSPGDLMAKKAYASALVGLGRDGEARPLLLELSQRMPGDWSIWTNLGSAERNLGNWNEAIVAYERGLEIDASNPEICADCAYLCRSANEHVKALKWFFAALQADPENTKWFVEWCASLDRLKKYEEAMSSLRVAWQYEKDNPELATTVYGVASALADWKIKAEAEAYLKCEFEAGRFHNFPPLSMVGMDWLDRVTQYQMMSTHISSAQKLKLKPIYPLCADGLQPSVGMRHERLRIGYLSADIHTHATAMLITDVLERHADVGLDWYMYSYGPSVTDSKWRDRISAAATVFRDLRLNDDSFFLEQICKDEIDILVDLKGWTLDFRVSIQANRPAPIIVTWLGFPGTIGHPALADYVIGDPVVTPLDHAAEYSETLALMPHCYQPNDSNKVIGVSPTRSEAGLPEDAFVFCSFNRVDKLTADMFGTWCEILQAVPGSVLWLMSDGDFVTQQLRTAARDVGIDPERLIFAPRVDLPLHLGRLRIADLALDSFPYTSHTTGSDALWAGLPLLALQGDTFASRVSSSLVSAAGVPELITHSRVEFRDRAIELAQDRAQLSEIRARLELGRSSCALFDAQGFARDLARLYHEMWDNYQAGVKRPIALLPQP